MLFAHAAELHTEETTQAEHLLKEPLIIVPAFILSVFLIYFILKFLKINTANRVLAIQFYLLIAGIATYSLMPVISIIAIVVGIVGSLFLSLTLLAKS